MNEPRLSINDIINNKFKEGTFINRLKELVQKRQDFKFLPLLFNIVY